MDNQLEELKKQWKGLNSVGSAMTECDKDFIPVPRNSSRRGRLMKHYRICIIISLVYIVVGPATLYPTDLLPLWKCVVLSLFFVVSAIESYIMYDKLRRLDFGRMTTFDLLKLVEDIYRTYIRQTICGISIVVPVLFMLFTSFWASVPAFVGGVVGAIVGGIIGIIKNREIRRNIMAIREELLAVER